MTQRDDQSHLSNDRESIGADRLGLVLFGIYLGFYVTFVVISAFASDLLEIVLPGGLNLAVVYGFGLILLALVLAGIYGALRRSKS